MVPSYIVGIRFLASWLNILGPRWEKFTLRVPSNLQSGKFGFNMTPMIDVVFLLIIFFLVSSHLAKQEVQRDLPLPGADSGIDPEDDQSPRVVINVESDGEWFAGTRSLGNGLDKKRENLRRRLLEKIAKSGKDVEVRIRSDRTVAYGRVEPILRTCTEAGIWNVTFAVIRRKDVR